MTCRSEATDFMHELGIATSILESVEKESRRHEGVRITKVGVKIGELAGVDVDALQFGFECMIKETEWEGLVLEVESIPRLQRCPKCEHEFRMSDFDPQCPKCGEFATVCVSGEELDIAFMEVEE
ncbi:MAG TPA: hydrogenase maturation nickel metallochaperone HypA [Candidatus Angelobacter sp.]|jgi:hydrogenase nickel incorporation protein HypA/HybF|nr:hydrogenase maturation nickel metallochaperone HypA [Candidatus Angelobacter sp.]